MDRFIKDPSKQYLKAVKAIQELITAESLDAADRAYASATHAAQLKQFKKKHKVKSSKLHVCPHTIAGTKCPGGSDCFNVPAADHMSFWEKSGSPHMIVTQPYDLSLGEIKDIANFCKKHGLSVTVEGMSWHFPGQTLMVRYEKIKEDK